MTTSQRCAPAEWNLREIFRFSHRFWREILVKFSVAHPNPGKRSAKNFTKISRQISRQFWQRKTEKIFTSALLQGSCSDNVHARFQEKISHGDTSEHPAEMICLVSQHGQLGAIPLPPFLSVAPLESMRSGGALPPPPRPKGYLSDTCAIYPMKTISSDYNSDLFWTRVWCIPGFGAENKSALFQDFLLVSAVLRVQGRFQNPRQTPVRTKLRLKRFPIIVCHDFVPNGRVFKTLAL